MVSGAYYYYFINPNSICSLAYLNEKSRKDLKEAYFKSVDFIMNKRIKTSFRHYKAKRRTLIKFFGIRFFDIKVWENLFLIYMFNIPIFEKKLFETT